MDNFFPVFLLKTPVLVPDFKQTKLAHCLVLKTSISNYNSFDPENEKVRQCQTAAELAFSILMKLECYDF